MSQLPADISFVKEGMNQVHEVRLKQVGKKTAVLDNTYSKPLWMQVAASRRVWYQQNEAQASRGLPINAAEPFTPGDLGSRQRDFNNKLDALQWVSDQYYPRAAAMMPTQEEFMQTQVPESELRIKDYVKPKKSPFEKSPEEIRLVAKKTGKKVKIDKDVSRSSSMVVSGSNRRPGSYVAGQSCKARGLQHQYVNKGSYLKCSICGSSKSNKSKNRVADL